jgi:excisionase family DNA binding protein
MKPQRPAARFAPASEASMSPLAQVIPIPSACEQYITLDEVARRLGYSTRWVHDRIRFDGLPSHQHARGSQHRFLWSEVHAWFELWNSK